MQKIPESFEEIERKASLANFHAVLKYRECTISALAKSTGISKRTLESYASGRVSLLDAKAGTVLRIADVLDVSVEVLLGGNMEQFYRRERNILQRRRKRMP